MIETCAQLFEALALSFANAAVIGFMVYLVWYACTWGKDDYLGNRGWWRYIGWQWYVCVIVDALLLVLAYCWFIMTL